MKAGRLILIVFLASALAAAGVLTYKRWPGLKKAAKREATNTASHEQLSSVPPFSTKEPDRYQATRIITSVGGDAVPETPIVTRILIARDGDKRREDYDSDTDFPTSYLEIPSGTFVLVPSKKVYTDIGSGAANPALQEQTDPGVDSSVEGLLNEPTAARYEKLGSENLNGRNATKYRVTSSGSEAPAATLVWIDETLGMPIRSETEVSADRRHSKLTIELQEIELSVDPKRFELPKDYRKVGDSELRDWLKQARAAGGRESPKP